MGEERRAGKVLRFTVSAALLLGPAALTACGDEEGPTVNEPEPTHTINEPAEPSEEVVPEPTPNLTVEEATGVPTPPEPVGEPVEAPPEPIPPG